MTLRARPPMRQRRVDALRRCAQRATEHGLPVAATVNPFAPEPPPFMPGSAVLMVAAEVTGISVVVLKSPKRGQHISYARQFACWLIRERLGLSYAKIGDLLNKSQWAAEDGVKATDQRLLDDWPMIKAWRNRAAELLGWIDMTPRRHRRNAETLARSYPRVARDGLRNDDLLQAQIDNRA